jgi:hypothetical protein
LAFPPPSSFSSGGKVWHMNWVNPAREHCSVNHKCRIISVKWYRNGIVVAEISNPSTAERKLRLRLA